MYTKIIKRILLQAKKSGASGVEVYLNEAVGFSTSVRLNEVETIEHNHDRCVDITLYFGQRMGSASSTDLSDRALQLAVEKACYMAKYAQEDPFAGLADRELLAFDYPDLDLAYPWSITVPQTIELAKEAEAAGLAYDKRITNSEGVTISSDSHHSCYGNSHDFIGECKATRHRVDGSFIAEDSGDKQRDYDYSVAIDAADLDDFVMVSRRAAEKSVARLGARAIDTTAVPVIFSASVAKSLWGSLLSAISGSNIYRQASFLLDSLAKQVLPEFVTVSERPHLRKTLGSAPYDNEGVRTVAKDIVHNGVLQSYLLGSYSARKLNMQPTGNAGGVHNLFISPTEHSFKELLQIMGKGLLVTELIGQGVNIITGDYSRGAFGYWVDHGEIQYPVHEITIAGNLREMLLNISALGSDLDRRGNIITGSVLLDHMTVAGNK